MDRMIWITFFKIFPLSWASECMSIIPGLGCEGKKSYTVSSASLGYMRCCIKNQPASQPAQPQLSIKSFVLLENATTTMTGSSYKWIVCECQVETDRWSLRDNLNILYRTLLGTTINEGVWLSYLFTNLIYRQGLIILPDWMKLLNSSNSHVLASQVVRP